MTRVRRFSRLLARALGVLSALAVGVVLALVLCATLLDVPASLRDRPASTRVLDRAGHELALVRDASGELMLPVVMDELSPWLVPALLAAEDARYYQHFGVDPLALGRAALQAIRRGRIVSGASTITQQLARTSFERPRSFAGKWRELALALRLEAEFDKTELLEAYLNRVSFGPRLRGLGAASLAYFDKPARALGLAEAAALVAIVRGPTRYDPRRFPERLRQRRDYVLGRLRTLGWAPPDEIERALAAPVRLQERYVVPGAHHFVRAAASGRFGSSGPDPHTLRSTLDGRLQAEVESLVRRLGPDLVDRHSSTAAAVVVENATGAVRAYVGSADYWSERWLGQNDGALALRQPGSTLKPFVYALALSELGLNAASVLSDLERNFPSDDGSYLPHNYDRRFHGPVRLSQALASSLNLPAVDLAHRLGPERVVDFLREVGFAHMAGAEPQYGPGVALGALEVQLVELVQAYAVLARAGEFLPLRFFEDAPAPTPRRVIEADVSRQIFDVLSDPRERAGSFGRDGPLEFDFPVAVKTGTSKGNRDHWVVGATAELSVGVWVGNFDGSPMLRSSGVTGAGPLFRAVLQAGLREFPGAGRARVRAARGVALDVCALSGLLATPACPHVMLEHFSPDLQPAGSCTWHRRACAGPACPAVEALPARYAEWAVDSGRAFEAAPEGLGPRILSPRKGARFVIDPNLARERQEVVFAARAEPTAALAFVLDDREVCRVKTPFNCPWRLDRGRHQLEVRQEDGAAARVEFSVE